MYATSSELGTPIFNGALIDMSVNQRSLIYWAQYYYVHVFSKELEKRPDEWTIDHDILLDTFIKQEESRRKNEEKMKKGSVKPAASMGRQYRVN